MYILVYESKNQKGFKCSHDINELIECVTFNHLDGGYYDIFQATQICIDSENNIDLDISEDIPINKPKQETPNYTRYQPETETPVKPIENSEPPKHKSRFKFW